MYNLTTLFCRLFSLSSLYANRMQWGIDCNLDDLLCDLSCLYNFIKVIQNNQCKIDPAFWSQIQVLLNQLEVKYPLAFCIKCDEN